jgi:hypothetical protein
MRSDKLEYDKVLSALRRIDTESDAERNSELIKKLFPEYTAQTRAWDIWRTEERRVWVTLSARVRRANESSPC